VSTEIYKLSEDLQWLEQQPAMEEPLWWQFPKGYLAEFQKYELHLRNLNRYKAEGFATEHASKELKEGFDFEISCQIIVNINGKDVWTAAVDKDYWDHYPITNYKRIRAIPHPEPPAAYQERIICAAIWYQEQPTAKVLPLNIKSGVVVAGLRHGYCIATFVALTGKRSVLPECGAYVQGFITSKDRFVDRSEAMTLAKEAGQAPTSQSFEELFSEDLY
jgi:hypothetical protein